MALEISGKVIQLLAEQTGTGKNGIWKRQDFVIETADQYPKKICFSAMGDKADMVKKLSTGETVKVSFNPESREYNGRWYTDLRAWKIESGSSNSGAPASDYPDLNQYSNYEPPLSADSMEKDDLPF